MSCGTVRSEVMNYFLVEKNPKSPLLTMQLNDIDRIQIQNYTFLPTDNDEIKTAQVRFDKIVIRGGMKKTKTRYIATITYNYDPKNTPQEVNDYALNPFGFCATNYRVDQEGVPINLELEANAPKENVAVIPQQTTSQLSTGVQQ